jgi:Rod binding domain-containing protein
MELSPLPLPLLTAANQGSADAQGKPSKTAAAAQQFEALFIGEMLKSVREASDDGWLGGGSDSSAETAFGMAENQFAQAVAASGGFGLAKTIQQAVEQENSQRQTQRQTHQTQAVLPRTNPTPAF